MKRILVVLLVLLAILTGCAPLQGEQEQLEQQSDTDTQENQAQILQIENKPVDGPQMPTNFSMELMNGNYYTVTLGELAYSIELESNMFVDYNIIYDDVIIDYFGTEINRKVGEVWDYSTFDSEQELADYLSGIDYDSSEGWINEPPEVIVKSDSYQNDSGKNIYYSITKAILDDTGMSVWTYTYAIPISDNVAVWVDLWAYENNRSVDEPRFRAIVDSIELV